MPQLISQLMTIVNLIGTVFTSWIHLVHGSQVPWKDMFKLSASVVASEFCEWVNVGIDAYIPHRKYQAKPHSSSWFSAASAAAIVYRNHFFRLYQHNLLNLKYSSDKLVIAAKGFLKLPNLHMLIKQESITSQKLGSRDFWQIANSVLIRGKSSIPPLFNSSFLHLTKQKCLLKTFLRTLILSTQVSLLLSPLELI